MIPFILAAVGGYLIGDSMKDSEKFADGGGVKSGLIGKRVRLIEMKEDPNPIAPGTMGTVVHVGGDVINVEWDNGRNLGLVEGVDEYEFTDEFAEGGILKDVADIEIEVEKMNSNMLELEVEFDNYDGSEDKYYFEYSLDKDNYSLSAIYDDKRNLVSDEKQQELESDEYLSNKLESAIFNALSTYADEKYESNRDYDYEDDYAEGGATNTIATTILKQLGGAGRLNAMTGAYNFRDLGNGVSFRIKNQRANYIKVTLNGMDLYDLEVGRIRGTDYKVVASHDNIYFDQLKPLIEKATGMYLSLFAKGGEAGANSFLKAGGTSLKMTDAEYEKFNQLSKKQKENVKSLIWLGDTPKSALDKIGTKGKKKKYAVLRSRMGEIIADIEVENEDRLDALKQFIDLGIDVNKGTIYFTDNPPYYY